MNVSNIKISLDTNVPGRSVAVLTRDFFYLPQSSSIDKDQEQNQTSILSNYPFFTKDVKYPMSSIKSLGKKESINFFFNERLFKRKLSALTRATTDAQRHQNAIENVKTMLLIFFPTSLPIKSNYHNSFEENIKQLPTQGEPSSIIPSFIRDLFIQSDEDDFSYLQLGTAKFTVIKVTWVNDIINHPEYRKLLDSGYRIWEWWNGNETTEGQEKKIKEKVVKDTNDFTKKWKETFDKIISQQAQYKNAVDSMDNFKGSSRYQSVSSIVVKIKHDLEILKTAIPDIKDVIKIIYDIYDYDNEAMKVSQQSSILPYTLKRDFGFDDLQKLAIKITLSDEIQQFLEHPHRYYELFEEKKEDQKSNVERKNKDLKAEIQKYSKVMDFVKLVSSFIKPRKPSNPELANMIKYYLNGPKKPSDILSKFMNEVHNIYLGDDDDESSNKIVSNVGALEIGVDELKKSSSSEKKEQVESSDDKSFEIYVQVDVVKGILDRKSMGKVKCLFRNAIAKKMYYSLKDNRKHKVELDKSNRFYLDIDALKQESKKTESVFEPSKGDEKEKKAEADIKEKTGGKTRKKKTRGVYNRRRTYRK